MIVILLCMDHDPRVHQPIQKARRYLSTTGRSFSALPDVHQLLDQKIRIGENLQSRIDYEWDLLKDPSTHHIPPGIADRSLEYMHQNGSRLRTLGVPVTKSWKARGPINLGGRTRALAYDLFDADVVLAGGVSGGMWRSSDGGATWTKTTGSDQLQSVTSIAQDPRPGFSNIWYYTTGEFWGNSANGGGGALYRGNGYFKSTDGGETWTHLENSGSDVAHETNFETDYSWNSIVHPLNGDVYVATAAGIRRSQDGGSSWTLVLDSFGRRYSDVAVTETGILYATLGGASPSLVLRSEDGLIWTPIAPPEFPNFFVRMVMAIAPTNSDVVYLLGESLQPPINHSLWKFTYDEMDGDDFGEWEDRTANLPDEGGAVGSFNSQASYNLMAKVSPTDEDVLYIGGINLYRSSNGFSTADETDWIGGYQNQDGLDYYPQHHADQHALIFSPNDPDQVISGHDGGLSKTVDITTDENDGTPVNWTTLNNAYLTTQAYTVALDPSSPGDDKLLIGFQDNGTWFTADGELEQPFIESFSGDGGHAAFGNNGLIRYISAQNGIIYKQIFANQNDPFPVDFARIDPEGGTNYRFITPYALDRNDDNIMYLAAGNTIWRNDDLEEIPLASAFSSDPDEPTSVGWDQLMNGQTVNSITALDVSKEEPAHVLYYGTGTGELKKMETANVGDPVAIDLNSPEFTPSAYINCIHVNPKNGDEVFVVFSNYEVKSVFRTTDGGDSWQHISGNLEENPDGTGDGPSVRWISSIELVSGTIYYVGTSVGLFSTDELNGTGTIWQQEDPEGIGNVVVPMVATRGQDTLVVAATHGNGIYSTRLDEQNSLLTPLDVTTSTQSSSEVLINWVDVSEDELGYIVERSTNSGTGFNQIGNLPVNAEAYTDQGLTPNTTYYYRIAARGLGGNSPYSEEASALTNPLEPPGNLTGDALASIAIELVWEDLAEIETGYRIERSIEALEGFLTVGTTAPDEINFFDIGLEPETTYYYKVYTLSGSGESEPTETVAITTLALIPPTSLQAIGVSSVAISLSWVDQSIGETGFAIQRSNDLVSGYLEIARVGANVTAFTDEQHLLPQTEYFYRVQGFSESSFSTFTNSANAITLQPESPSNLVGEAISNNAITLSWTDNTVNETGFLVQRSTTPGSGFTTIVNLGPDVTMFTDEGLEVANDYYYRVAAEIEGIMTQFSNEIQVSTLIPDLPKNAPSGLLAEPLSKEVIRLSWEDTNDNETGYVVEQSVNVAGFYTPVDTASIDEVQLDITNLEANTKYFYRVYAINLDGAGPISGAVEARTIPNPPPAPVNLVAVTISEQAIALTWTDNSVLEESFSIKVAQGSDNRINYNEVDVVSANTTSLVIEGLQPNTLYFFRINALNAGGESFDSNVASATTLPPVPGAPTNLTATQDGPNEVLLRWQDNTNFEEGFIIERANPEDSLFFTLDEVGPNASTYVDPTVSEGVVFLYRVMAHNISGQSEPSNIASNGVVSSLAPDLKKELKLFPNPANAFVNLSLEEEGIGTVELSIMDLSGSVIMAKTMTKTDRIFDLRLETINLPPAVYVLRLTLSESTILKRLVVTR